MRLEKYLGRVEVEPLEVVVEPPSIEEVVVNILYQRQPNVRVYDTKVKYRGQDLDVLLGCTDVYDADTYYVSVGKKDVYYRDLSTAWLRPEAEVTSGSAYVRRLDGGRVAAILYPEPHELDRIAAITGLAWLTCGMKTCTTSFKPVVVPRVEVTREILHISHSYKRELTFVKGYPEHVVSFLLYYPDLALRL